MIVSPRRLMVHPAEGTVATRMSVAASNAAPM
jgi:hypothetical protein